MRDWKTRVAVVVSPVTLVAAASRMVCRAWAIYAASRRQTSQPVPSPSTCVTV